MLLYSALHLQLSDYHRCVAATRTPEITHQVQIYLSMYADKELFFSFLVFRNLVGCTHELLYLPVCFIIEYYTMA